MAKMCSAHIRWLSEFVLYLSHWMYALGLLAPKGGWKDGTFLL